MSSSLISHLLCNSRHVFYNLLPRNKAILGSRNPHAGGRNGMVCLLTALVHSFGFLYPSLDYGRTMCLIGCIFNSRFSRVSTDVTKIPDYYLIATWVNLLTGDSQRWWFLWLALFQPSSAIIPGFVHLSANFNSSQLGSCHMLHIWILRAKWNCVRMHSLFRFCLLFNLASS